MRVGGAFFVLGHRWFALAFVLAASSAAADPLTDGVNYLLTQRSGGAFGLATSEEPVVATTESLHALRAVGLGTGLEAQDAETYLSALINDVDSELSLRRQRALSNTALVPPFAVFGAHAAGFEADDAAVLVHALLLTKARGEAQSTIGRALAFRLAALQGPLGCFSVVDNQPSAELTAMAALALSPYATSGAGLINALNASLGCLSALQLPDGSLGTVPATAVTLLIAQQTSSAPAALVTGTRTALLGAQLPNGSWGSVRATALAVQALAGQGGSGLDWRVPMVFVSFGGEGGAWTGVLTVTPQQVEKGTNFTVTLPITNASSITAPATHVAIVARPALVGNFSAIDFGSFAIPSIAAGGTYNLVVSLPTTGFQASTFHIYGTVDPLGVFPDVDRSNNVARGRLDVVSANDLEVTAGSFSITTVSATQAQITATVRNLGQPLPVPVTVELFKSGRTGPLLASATIPAGFAKNGSFPISATFATSALNGPTPFQVFVDFADVLPEGSEDNNRATRWYDATALVVAQDLSATGLVVTSPTGTLFGRTVFSFEPYTVQFVVGNASTRDAWNVPVAIDFQGVRTRGTVPFVGAQSTAIYTETRSERFTGNNSSLFAHVDPDATLNDPQRNNNTAQTNMGYSQSAIDEVNLSSFSQSGLTTDAQIIVGNTGGRTTSTLVLFTNALTGEEVRRLNVDLVAGQNSTIAVPGIGAGSAPVVLEACIDPFNAFREANEANNCRNLTFLGNTFANLGFKGTDFKLTPPGAAVGEKVHVDLAVTNTTGGDSSRTQVSGKAVIEWWQGRPGFPDGEKLGETPVDIPVGATTTAAFEFIRREGKPEIFARLLKEQQFDPTPADNIAGVSLYFERAVRVRASAPNAGWSTNFVLAGRLTGQPEPELVVGLRGFIGATDMYVLEVLQRQPSGDYDLHWEKTFINGVGHSAALVDLERDGSPELVFSYLNSPTNEEVVVAYTFSGQTKWEVRTTRPNSPLSTFGPQLCLGDINGDGVADVGRLNYALDIYSGDTGQGLRHTLVDNSGADGTCQMLDVEGDGTVEIFGIRGSEGFLFNNDGTIRWRRGIPNNSRPGQVVDLQLDGTPEFVVGSVGQQPGVTGNFGAFDLATGTQIFNSGQPGLNVEAVGAARQNGLRYSHSNPFIFGFNQTAFGPDGTPLWSAGVFQDTGTGSQTHVVSTLADLTGAGRPQVIMGSFDIFPFIVDARDGTPLAGAAPSSGDQEWQINNQLQQSPLVVDLAADGKPHILFPHYVGPPDNRTGSPSYGRSEIVIFSSPHWTGQTRPTWPTFDLIQGRVDDDLKLTTGATLHRWWTTHNTVNQQFFDSPETLLADLALAAVAQTSATAGVSHTVTATLKNLGGLPASNITVGLYDGDPAAGGALLSTAVVPGPLAARAGSTSVQLTWPNPQPAGLVTLYVVANSDEAIAESGRENNTLAVKVLVNAPADACDLRVVPASLASLAPTPVGGSPLSLSATVDNAGSQPCPASRLDVFDGLGTGSPPFGSASVAALAPGASATVTVSGTPIDGARSYLFLANADHAALDHNPANDRAVLEVLVGASTTPDLVAEALTLNPAPAYVGERITLTLTVRNRGVQSPPSVVRFTLPGSIVDVELPALVTGDATQVSAVLPAPAASSLATATVDPNASLPEFEEGNNSASAALSIAPAPLALTLTAAPSSATANHNVLLSATATNLEAQALDTEMSISILDPTGAVLATALGATEVIVAPGAPSAFSTNWNTGTTPAGSHTAVLEARVDGRVAARTTGPLTITAQTPVSASLAVDRALYRPGDAVTFTQRVANDAVNVSLAGATATLTVREPSGTILSVSSRTLGSLGPTTSVSFYDVYALGAQASYGFWSGRLEVRDAQGALVAQAEAFFALDFTASQTVTADATAPALISIGQPVPVSVTLTNTGSLDLTNGAVEVLLLNASGSNLSMEASALQAVSVLAGQTAPYNFSLATAGLPTGPKLVVVRLDGRVLDTIAVDAITQTDTEPPIIAIAGVVDQQLGNADVTPVITIVDASPYAAVIELDGQPWAGGTVTTEGNPHVLTVTATDAFNNASQVTVRFTIDKTPPAVTLAGVNHGAHVNTSVTLTFSASDLHPGTTSSTLNGVPFTSGDTVSAEGNYTWFVTSTDAAGNTNTETRTFTIDTIPPVLAVLPAPGYYNQPQQVSWTAQDTSPVFVAATLDSVPISTGDTVSAEGAHVLAVSATDAAGNTTTLLRQFTLDFTSPLLGLSGPAHGAYVNSAVTLSWAATDSSPVTISGTLNGLPIASGQTVSTEGVWVWAVGAVDAANNTSSEARTFAVDTTPPACTVNGVTDGELRGGPVTPTWTGSDTHLASTSATIDGLPFSSGDTVSGEGDHLLVVTCTDLAGNATIRSVSFSIDTLPPVLTLSGVASGQHLNAPVTLIFSAADAHPGATTATLDGASFSSGGTVSSEGAHTWVVTSTDTAGNTATQTRVFTLDFTAPAVAIGGVASGVYYRTPQAPTFTATDANLDSVVATLNGAPFASGTTVSAEGSHTLTVRAIDRAGNNTLRAVSFTLDFTPPVIVVGGVSDGATAASFTITFSATDASPTTVTALLDASPFTSGWTVTALGPHTLDLDATDAAGNTASRTLAFTVSQAPQQCADRTLSARREYRPSRWTDAFVRSTAPLGFALPLELNVASGNAGQGWATLTVRSGHHSRTCKYEGQSPKEHPTRPADVAAGLKYRLHHCTDSWHGKRAGDQVSGTEVVLHVHDGDDRRGATVVDWPFVETRPCGGGTVTSGTRPGHHHGQGDNDDDDHGPGHGNGDGHDHGDDHEGDCRGDRDDDGHGGRGGRR